eukprot:gene19559-biopygen27315
MASHVRYPQPRKLHVQLWQGLNLQQQIRFITRPKVVNKVKAQDRGSIIDHVWTKLKCRCSIQHALGSLSDHEAIRINHGRSAPPAKSKGKYVHRRLWRKVESRKILEVLDQEMPRSSWGILEKDAQLAVARWHAAWDRVKTELAPKKRIPVKPKTKLIKVSAQVRAARKERNRLHRIASKSGATAEDKTRYWRSRDAAIKLHRGNVEEFVKAHWKKAGDKPLNPAHWRLVDALTGRKARDRVEPECSPDRVNDAFLAKPAKIRAPMLGKTRPKIKKRDGATLERFMRVSKEDVMMALSKARSTHSVGVDEVPMSVLKRLGDDIASYVAVLSNAIIARQWWPPEWKQAEVHPLWKKKGSKNDPTTYRPISLLPAVARLVERLVAQQLKAHVTGLLPAFQHGFRPKHSCQTALMQLIEYAAKARNEGEVVAMASADMAGAFDTVDHDILIEKLEKLCGLTGGALSLMRSYLQGREQRTVMGDDRQSGWRAVPCGVPQGSVLGPLLFALYTLDVREHVRGAHIVQYADDITLVVSAKCPNEVTASMNKALAQLQEYANANRLAPEPSKTQLLLVGSAMQLKRVATLAPKCEMGGQEIFPKQVIKVLGVKLDDRLSWEQHNAAAAGRATAIARNVKRACRYIGGAKERARLYKALCHPHLDYCQTALAAPTATANASLEKAYNRTARMAVGAKRSTPALTKLGWRSWERRRTAVRAAFVAKVREEGEPAVLNKLFPPPLAEKQEGMLSRAARRGELVEPASRTAAGEKAFSIWAPRVVNQILSDDVFEDCSSEEEQEQLSGGEIGGGSEARVHRVAPSDEFAAQRKTYYAELIEKFAGPQSRETTDGHGRVCVWTDGSFKRVGGI